MLLGTINWLQSPYQGGLWASELLRAQCCPPLYADLCKFVKEWAVAVDYTESTPSTATTTVTGGMDPGPTTCPNEPVESRGVQQVVSGLPSSGGG